VSGFWFPFCGVWFLVSAMRAPSVAGSVPELCSWRDGATRQTIVDFVTAVTTEDSADFVPPEQRIAVFDNDGTLWSEQPMYVQMAFAIDRARTLAKERTDLCEHPVIAMAAQSGQEKALMGLGIPGLLELVGLTHADMDTVEFGEIVRSWLDVARHPTLQRPYTDLIYQPMLELMAYLRTRDFRTYIVSAGGTAFMRVVAEALYGIPPEQVIGSTIKTNYVHNGAAPRLIRRPEVDLINDGATKPGTIEKVIGRSPLMAFGNSDGDFEMLDDDADREVAYDRDSTFGRLDRSLSSAPQQGWLVVSMRRDWHTIFPEVT
jgi:phosphoglycolate phosphatase-like HAD superfamily hydrolase